jgi:rfaE bifunctional protein nucleotidyltransferase chain/domain
LDFREKILDAEALPAWREALRAEGRTLAATNGCFDILHAGHVNYLQAARNKADALIVGLNSDRSTTELKGPDRPIHTEADRAAVLAALESVNAIFIFDDLRATSFLQIAQPDIYVKGGDYTVDQLPAEERAIIEAQGGRITVLGHLPGKSSTELARRILEG